MSNKQVKQQKNLEEIHKQQQNFFYESVSTKLKSVSEKQFEATVLLEKIEEDVDLTPEQFELMGCLSYIVGIDYTNQPHLQEEICKKVAARFEPYKFETSLIRAYTNALFVINESIMTSAKEKMKEKFISNIVLTENKDKVIFNELRALVKKVIGNSIVPVNLVVGINDIISKTTYTYQDLIKLNTILNKSCKYVGGKATKAYIKLYSNELWVTLLKKATIHFDNQKFSIVYFDGILSVIESQQKFDNMLFPILLGNVHEIGFEQIKSDYDAKQEEILANTKETEVVKYEKLEEKQIDELAKGNPLEFVLNILSDILGFIPETSQDIMVAIEKLLNETDHSQHVYHYIKANLSKIADCENKYNLDYVDIHSQLETLIEQYKKDYKTSVEFVCKDISEDITEKIKNYVNSCVNDLILDSDEQKQYLLSQIIDSNIKTYQHLEQIMSLIESCDIIGEQLISYVVLNKYINSNSELVESFKEKGKIVELESKISFYMGFEKLFGCLVPKKETVETPKQ